MREIKYRFWSVAGLQLVERIEFDTKRVWLTDGDCRDIEEGYLMQYTGLKDKNGKEIYEGDILKNNNEEMIISIRWDITGANRQFDEHGTFDDGVGRGKRDFTIGLSKHCEVIGNIYENPELLA